MASAVLLLALAAAAPSEAAPRLRVGGWTTTMINQETVRTGPGGSVPVCQAIPPVSLAPRLRWSGARPGTDVRLRLTPPGHAPTTRRITLRRAAGTRTLVFTARDLGLRPDTFEAGVHRLQVRHGGRVLARATLRLVPGGTC